MSGYSGITAKPERTSWFHSQALQIADDDVVFGDSLIVLKREGFDWWWSSENASSMLMWL